MMLQIEGHLGGLYLPYPRKTPNLGLMMEKNAIRLKL
jgi:hypothetical protein